jgi:hypothetical protein
MSRSLAIVAVGAVCVGALGAAITLPALVLGGSDTPPVGLPIAGSGTRTVVQAAPLPAASRATRRGAHTPRLLPSLASSPGARARSQVSRRSAVVAPARPSRPKQGPGGSEPTPVTTRPATPQPATPQPAEQEQPLLTMSSDSKKAKHKKHKKHKKSHHPTPPNAKRAKHDKPKGEKQHPTGGQKPKHHEGPKPKHDDRQKPPSSHGPKPKDGGHGNAVPPGDQGGTPPKGEGDKPPKDDGGRGPDDKGPKR